MRYQARLVTALLIFISTSANGEGATHRPTLLIVGVPHFANPGRDVVNMRIADVKTEQRQHEIEAVVERLAAFKPTRIAIEWSAARQHELDQRFDNFVTANLRSAQTKSTRSG